ncbi:hypothetical protein HJC23_005949 [Cyclotella cryptica]|uniref:Scaffold protein Nfu/NifU N-terminal domain-containing protein n=1 Tax=Cyclotella cryptica TaxID=29204 RepID=A0ABD3QZA6_9STRA
MMNASSISNMTNALILRRSFPNPLRRHASLSISPSRTAAATATAPTGRKAASISSLPTIHLFPRHSLSTPPTTPPFPHHQPTRSLFIQTATTPNPESLKFIPNGRLVLGHDPQNENVDDTPSDGTIQTDTDDTSNETDTNGFYATRKDHELISRSPLVKSLFALDAGIKSIFLGYDFITVTKYAEAHWSHLQTPIFGAIMDFYSANLPAVRGEPEITDTTILEEDGEVVAMIKELLESRIRPAVQEDGMHVFALNVLARLMNLDSLFSLSIQPDTHDTSTHDDNTGGDIRYVGFEEETGIVTVKLAGSCVGCPSSSVTLKNGVENMLMHYIPEVTSVISLEEEEEEREDGGDVVVEQNAGDKKMKTYEERLAAAGIPFSD